MNEITTEAELYSPSIDNTGNYIDRVPPFSKGIRCPCGSRKDKIYDTVGIFSAHIKTKHHQRWLQTLNLNKANYYLENEQMKETLQMQRLIIARMEKELNSRLLTIDYLTKQLTVGQECATNLIDL
jgi:hypothetical protein